MKKLLLILICLFVSFEVKSEYKMSDMRFSPLHWGDGMIHMMDKTKTLRMSDEEYWIYTLVNLDSQENGIQSFYRFMIVNCKKKKFKLITTVSYEKKWGGGKIIKKKDHLRGFSDIFNFWKKPKFPSGDETLIGHTCVQYEKEQNGTLENWVNILENQVGNAFVDMDNIKKNGIVVNFSQLVNFKKTEDDKYLTSTITEYAGDCNTFEGNIIKICRYDNHFGKGNRIGSCKRFNEISAIGISQKKIIERVCSSCEMLHQIYTENSGKKLKNYECDLDYFKSIIDKDSGEY